MSLSILQRPKGYILSATGVSCAITNHSTVTVVVATSHGLVTGQTIYLVTDVEEYNGFFDVEFFDVSNFRLLHNQTSDYVTFIKALSSATYYVATATHGFSCVHLPITYKISNTLYPTNSVDTARTISTLTNNSGFAQLGLSGSLGTFEDLSFVKISGANDSDLDGVYQIIDKVSTSSVILNLDYTTVNGAGILGASIQLYYGNYNVVVEVWAGISAGHTWASQKPYELAATLELIPDENNEVFFSVSDILKAYVKSENNLLLATLSDNTDAWVNFYIKTAEQYDSSNGYAVTTTLTSFTSDLTTFEGFAVNAKLAFKNIHSGYLSEYLMTGNTSKFLTLFLTGVLFSCGDDTPDCYSDISFILPPGYSSVNFIQQYYTNDSLMATTTEQLSEADGGVYRMPLDPNCVYDRVDVHLETEDEVIEFLFVDGVQEATGDVDWILDVVGNNAQVTLTSGLTSEKIGWARTFYAGRIYNLTQRIIRTGTVTGVQTVNIYLYTTLGGGVYSGLISSYSYTLGTGNPLDDSESFTFSPSSNASYIVFEIVRTAGSSSGVYILESTTVEGGTISETKEFTIDCGCADQEIRLSWLNNLAGFDYWVFTAQTGHAIDITEAGQTLKNIFPNWPNSYGAFADTIRKQTNRTSIIKQFITSQHLTQDQADAIAFIKSSVLVQIINSRQDRRTAIVDTDSFLKYQDGDKTFTVSFNILYTDDIPSQTV